MSKACGIGRGGRNGAHVQQQRLREALGLGAYAKLLALWAQVGGATVEEARAKRASFERGRALREWQRRRKQERT